MIRRTIKRNKAATLLLTISLMLTACGNERDLIAESKLVPTSSPEAIIIPNISNEPSKTSSELVSSEETIQLQPNKEVQVGTETIKPSTAPKPLITTLPSLTPKPVESVKPIVLPTQTPKPLETMTPSKSPKPMESVVPSVPPKPVETVTPSEIPVETVIPLESPEPIQTNIPLETSKPVETSIPLETPKPVNTVFPSETPRPVPAPSITPKPIETPRPVPTETPKPVPPITMSLSDLFDKIYKEISLPAMENVTGDMVKELYYLEAQNFEEAIFKVPTSSDIPVDLAIIKLKDANDYYTIEEALKLRAEDVMESFADLPDQYHIAKNYQIKQIGKFVLYSISQDQEAIYNIFEAAVSP